MLALPVHILIWAKFPVSPLNYSDSAFAGIVMKFMLEKQGTLLDHAEAFGLSHAGASMSGYAQLLWMTSLSTLRPSIFLIALEDAFLMQNDLLSPVSQPS